ncbi:MAG: FAD-binding oxidoreductase [Thermoplasmata archaeon]|nr:FAD-binding oxidoreductase [Thermoplasmata archaeon]
MTGPSRADYRVVLVGGGIVGLFTAYHLARAGAGPILVLERGFLSSGASGRNGGGVRQQWDTPATIRLAREAVGEYRRFGRAFGTNIWFRQGGYLFLSSSAEEEQRLQGVHEAVAREGLPAKRLTPAEVGALVPALNLNGVAGGAYLASDGTLYPFPAVWGLYEACKALGVEVALGVEALGVDRVDGRVHAIQTSEGRRTTSAVVDVAGGWSKEFAARCGLDVPNRPTRHEILATEPLKPFLDPMVVRLSDGLYLSQTMRGEIVGGLSLPRPEGPEAGMRSSPEFLTTMARALVGLVPRLRPVRVLRAWSGYYDDTPDGLPVIGEDPRLPGFFHGNGFGGHGFMLAPASSKRIAKAVLGEPTDLDPSEFSPARFQDPAHPARPERLQLG